jgi:hypothetical protein
MLGPMTPIALILDRVEADRLIVALDRNATVTELPAARRLAAAARRGELPSDGVVLARRCLRAEGNASALLGRLLTHESAAVRSADPAHARRVRRRPRAHVYD